MSSWKSSIFFICSLGLFLGSHPLMGRAQTHLSVIVLPADQADAVRFALYQAKAQEATQWLASQPGIQLLPVDSLNNLIGEPLTPLFADEFDPFSLAAINQQAGLDGVLFFSFLHQEGADYMEIQEVAFPSGILGERIHIRLSDSPEWKWDRIFSRSFKSLLSSWQQADSLLQQPFPPQVRGLVILTDDLSDSLYSHHCRMILEHLPVDESKKPLRLKILKEATVLSQHPLYPAGFSLIDRTGAEYLFSLHLKEARLMLRMLIPADSAYQRPVCEWRLPMIPAIPQLTFLQTPADSAMLHLLGEVFFFPPDRAQTLKWVVQRSPSDYRDDAQAAAVLSACIRGHKSLQTAGFISNHPLLPWLRRGYENIAQFAANKHLQAWSWLHLGVLLQEIEGQAQAVPPLRRADSLFAQLHDVRGVTYARSQLAAALRAEEKWPEAFAIYERAVATPADSLTLAFLLREMALIREHQDQPEEAVRLHRQAAAVYDQLGRPFEAAMLFDHLSEYLRHQGRLYLSLAFADTLLMRAQAMSNEPATARAHFHRGLNKLKLQQWDEALIDFTQALDHMEALGDHRGMARTDLNLGAIYWQKGDSLEARRHYVAALQEAGLAEDSTAIFLSYINLAEWYVAAKDWPRAQYYYDRGLTLAEQFGNTEEIAKITYAKGLALLEEGRLRPAYELLHQALIIGKGAATGDAQKEEAFLRKLLALIGQEEPAPKTDSPSRQLLSTP